MKVAENRGRGPEEYTVLLVQIPGGARTGNKGQMLAKEPSARTEKTAPSFLSSSSSLGLLFFLNFHVVIEKKVQWALGHPGVVLVSVEGK